MIYEVKTTCKKTLENGLEKKMTESYLVKAETFAEAELKMGDYAVMYILRDFSVQSIRKSRFSEIFCEEKADSYYEFQIAIITLDERTGREKQAKKKILINAEYMEGAKLHLKEKMKNLMMDYRILSIKESLIMDIVNFDE